MLNVNFVALALAVLLVTSLISISFTQDVLADSSAKEIKSADKKPLVSFNEEQIKAQLGLQPNEKRVIVIYKNDVKKADKDKLEQKGGKIKLELDSLDAVAIHVDQNKIKEISSDPNVAQVLEDTIVYASLNISVPQIGANLVQAGGITGKNVKVCVIDTGVDDTHPALNPLVAEKDFVNNDNDATDDHGHGTHVAGIIASRDAFFKGVAPDASLMAAKVLGSTGSGFESVVADGISWCVSNGADVINLSLGGGSFPSTCDGTIGAIAVNNAVNAGVIVAAASGNGGFINAISTPACASKAIAVGAVTQTDGRTPFSNEGPELDVVAPGSPVVSLRAPFQGGGFTALTGTSMATPHVAGLAALLLEKNPNLLPQQVRTTIQNTALDLVVPNPPAGPGFDTVYGYGRIRANDAVSATLPATVSVPSATGAGNVKFSTNNGGIQSLSAIPESTLPTLGKPALQFPFGFFSYVIAGITPGSSATITITFPSNVPAGTKFWKENGGTWTNISSLVTSNDGDGIILLTIQDGQLGDADGIANGQIVDPIGGGLPLPMTTGILSVNAGGPGTVIDTSGTGFTPGSTVTIRFDSTVLTTTTAVGGKFTNIPITIPVSAPGMHSISASDGVHTFSKQFNIFVTRIVATQTTSFLATTNSGPPGSPIHLYGKGFAGNAGATVTISIDGAPVATTPVSKVGSFKAILLTIPPTPTSGTHTISATDGTNFASSTFYIVSP